MGSKEAVVLAALESEDPINLGEQTWKKWRKAQGVASGRNSERQEDSGDNGLGSRDRSKVPHGSNRWDMNYDVPGTSEISPKDPFIEMKGVKVSYGERTVLGDWQQDVQGRSMNGLWWNIHRGERWAVFGSNGMPLPIAREANLTLSRIWKDDHTFIDLLRPSSVLFAPD